MDALGFCEKVSLAQGLQRGSGSIAPIGSESPRPE